MKKSDIYQEDGVNLASKVPERIATQFKEHAKATPGQNLKTNLASSAQMWNVLPLDLQHEIHKNIDSKKLYQAMVNWIRQNEFDKIADKLSPEKQAQIVAIINAK